MSFDNKLVQFYNQSLYPRRPVLALSYWSCGFPLESNDPNFDKYLTTILQCKLIISSQI